MTEKEKEGQTTPRLFDEASRHHIILYLCKIVHSKCKYALSICNPLMYMCAYYGN